MTLLHNIETTLLKSSFDKIDLPNASIFLKRRFIESHHSKTLFDKLKSNIHWKQPNVKVFGKIYPTPRLVAWYGDTGIRYKYSGLVHKAETWNTELYSLKKDLNLLIPESNFNSVLLNYYRNGDDKMGWHADNEKELGLRPVIASLNIGATRRFDLRQKNDKNQKQSIYLENGDLLIMADETQEYWHHQVPKEKKVQCERINLTFRKILQ